jgi:molybdopterin/thiamine biosynthesis adenylyltransferase
MTNEQLAETKKQGGPDNTICVPYFYRAGNIEERKQMMHMQANTAGIQVFDTLWSQLNELIKSRNPRIKYTAPELNAAANDFLGNTLPEECGVWVYYPWSKRLVHILDEAEFTELRTNRNKYKITDEERIRLSKKRIGVIGLSVGQSVSVTLAMERSFGELRIADFDELEITNLNRLRSGIHNMGLKKTVVVAREIAEIDPFLKVTCFHDGINDNNIQAFLLENGKLDVLIDECDSVDVKINCRIAAKRHQIPVLMEASDRGTIDIERFDLEPGRPILHGLVSHLDISKLKGLTTNEEKLPYILPIAGMENMSARFKASAVEVGQTISTWPQLASAVTQGGGITADVCRRVLLGLLHVSGRYYIDIEQLIADPVKEVAHSPQILVEPLTIEKMEWYANKVRRADTGGLALTDEVVNTLVEAARVAPSAGNNQPWKWYFNGDQLFLFHDMERSASLGDFNNLAACLSFGTAIENLELKSSELGLAVHTSLFPLAAEGGNCLVATFRFSESTAPRYDELVRFINHRYTNRNPGNGKKIHQKHIDEMMAAAAIPGQTAFKFTGDDKDIRSLADITGKAEKLRIFIEEGHFELFEKEMRWTNESACTTKDGVDIRTLGLSAKDEAGLRLLKDQQVIKYLNEWKGGQALENMTRGLVSSSSGLGLITAASFVPENFIQAGKGIERIWLSATKNRIAVQPVLAPILHFARLIHGNGKNMPQEIQAEFQQLYKEFTSIWKLAAQNEEPLFLFRFCLADESKIKSLRLALDDILIKKRKPMLA